MKEDSKPDVMRHRGDTTVRVVKRGGKPIGEIGIDAEASEGNGSYYVKLYDGSYDAVGFDTAAEALAELRAAISEGITETAGVEESSTKNVTGVMKKYLPKSMWNPILSHTGKSKHDNADGSKTSHVWRLRNLVRSFRGQEFDAWKQAVEQELGDGYEVTSEWPTPSVRYIQMNEAHIQTGVTETAAVKYGVFAKGGSVGSQRFRDDPLKTFDTKEEAVADARRRRSGLSKGERGYYRMGYVVKPIKGVTEDDVDEGLKQKLAGAALAGAMALGAGGAQAQSTDRFDPAWGTSGYNTSIRSDVSSNKSMNTADPSKDTNDFQKRIQSVTGPNAKGEYKVVVMQGHDIVSHYVTKTPPPEWLYKEDAESKTDEGVIDNIKNTVRAANYDRLARRSNSQAVAGGGLAPPAQFRALSAKGDQRAQKAQDIRKGSAEQVDEIDMGLVGDAVAGAAMGLGSVGLGSYIGHKIGNKIGQKFVDRDKRKEAEAGSEKMKAIEKARADRIAANKAYREHENLYGYELEQDHPEYQNRVNLGNKKFRNMDVPSAFDEEQQVAESVDPIEQLRADIKRFAQ
jgi:hypothetical protein